MKPIKLSIIICSIHQRSTLGQLLERLQQQARSDETEILISIDAGQDALGNKRNRLVQSAIGQYIAHIDDDDMVDPSYLAHILGAIDTHPTIDAVAVRGRRTHDGGVPVEFDYSLAHAQDPRREGETVNGVVWRSPGHLCAIRAELAKKVIFPSPRYGEDLAWGAQLAPLLTSCVHASAKVLYHYQWDPHKNDPRDGIGHLVRANNHAAIFTPQYTKSSGPGSTIEHSKPYREALERVIEELQIKSIVDLGCGDLTVMGATNLGGATYLGVDVIRERIERNFQNTDIRRTTSTIDFMAGDARVFLDYMRTASFKPPTLLVCKDVIQHWTNAEVVSWLANVRDWILKDSSNRMALVTNCNYGPTVNQDIHAGGWRAVDLTVEPFARALNGCEQERILVYGHGELGGIKDVVLIK